MTGSSPVGAGEANIVHQGRPPRIIGIKSVRSNRADVVYKTLKERRIIMVSLERYDVSEDGVIIDKQTNKPVKIFKSNKYLQCCIFDENGKHIMGVHNVVAQIYCDNWFDGCVVHHKDGNQQNNCVDNLECLQLAEHSRRHQKRKYYDKKQECAFCKKEFIWTAKSQSCFYNSNCKTGPYCSKSCRSKSIKGKPPKNERKIICLETNTIYKSIREASNELKISYNQLWRCLKSNYKSVCGLHFKYI